MLSCFSCVWLFATPWTIYPTTFLCPWGFFRQEYWSRLPCPPPGDIPDPGTEPTSLMSPALAGGFFTAIAPLGKLYHTGKCLHLQALFFFGLKQLVEKRKQRQKPRTQSVELGQPGCDPSPPAPPLTSWVAYAHCLISFIDSTTTCWALNKWQWML